MVSPASSLRGGRGFDSRLAAGLLGSRAASWGLPGLGRLFSAAAACGQLQQQKQGQKKGDYFLHDGSSCSLFLHYLVKMFKHILHNCIISAGLLSVNLDKPVFVG